MRHNKGRLKVSSDTRYNSEISSVLPVVYVVLNYRASLAYIYDLCIINII